MESGFWMGFFGAVTSIATLVAAHLKNVSQDKAALKRDSRINALEVELKHCHEERVEIKQQLIKLNEAKK